MDVRELARTLVDIPSHEDEREAGDAIERWLREETDAVVTRDDAPGGGNVIGRKGPSTAETTLALVGHHDVVPPDDSQVLNDNQGTATRYRTAERNGRLYGRGSADMKGAVAAGLCAFRDATPECELVFAAFTGEESGGVGCRHAIDQGFSPDYAVVGEGSTGYSAEGVIDVAVVHKGRRGSTVLAHGAAAHASEPEAGTNAIYRAADAVQTIRHLEIPATEVLGHRVQGSIAVTGIAGGAAWNVIPERCEVTIDERTVPGDRVDLARVQDSDGIEWTVDQDLPPMACEDPGFAGRVLDAAQAAQSGTPEHVAKPHATDAGWLATRAGTECVVCGPAEQGEAHTADESVSLTVLEQCQEIYRRTAEAVPATRD